MILNKNNINFYRLLPNAVEGITEIKVNYEVHRLFYNSDINYPLFSFELNNIVFLNEDSKQSVINLYNINVTSNAYKSLRKKEYDKLNQNELMYNDKINGTDTWIVKIQEIKAMYPKPNDV